MSSTPTPYLNPRRLWHGAMVPNWLLERSEVSQGAKLAFARLCQFYNDTYGFAFPDLEQLGEALGVTARQAHRYISELEKLHLVVVEQTGLNRSNRYRFPLHPWMGLMSDPDRTDMSTPEKTSPSGPEMTETSTPYFSESVIQNQQGRISQITTSALAPLRVAFAPEGFTVPPQLIEQWRTAYPAVDVEREVRAAHAWAVANPANRKSNWTRFLVNWLARSQERAPRVRDREDQTMDERALELARR